MSALPERLNSLSSGIVARPANRRFDFLAPTSSSVSQPLSSELPGQQTDAWTAAAYNVPAGPSLSPEEQGEAERRYQIIAPLLSPDRFPEVWAKAGGRRGQVVAALCSEHAIPRTTLYRWLDAWSDNGLSGLVRKPRKDSGHPRALNPAALEFLLAAALPAKGAYGRLTVREIYRAYSEERAWRARRVGANLSEIEERRYCRFLDADGRLGQAALLPEASYETFRAWYKRIPSPVRTYARDGLEAFANSQDILSHRAISEVLPLDYAVMDHRLLDLFCMVRSRGGCKLVRPWLTAAIDMRTRKWLAWAIVETPSSDSIATVVKALILRHGAPKALYWDNGKDFRCEWLEGEQQKDRKADPIGEGSDGFRGVLDSLGIRVHHAIVRRARSKLIEANFRNTAEFDRSLPYYCGHKPSARPEGLKALVRQHERWGRGEIAESPFPTIEEVARLYSSKLEELNERPHSGEGMRKILADGRLGWYCPNEVWELLISRVERRTVSDDLLRFCFSKRRALTVRNGEVRATFGGQPFHYRAIDNSLTLMRFNGSTVELAYDPLDLGLAAVYHESRFIGVVSNAELRRMGEDSFVQDERDRRAARRTVRKFIDAAHDLTYVPGPEERLARREAVATARLEPKRAEAPIEVPPEIAAAALAKRADEDTAAFYGGGELERVDEPGPRYADGDDEFNFFSRGEN
jgi:transposase InsO family protein